MSVSRAAPNAGHFYSNIVSPIKVDMQFTVNSTDSGGFGITSLKSNGYVQSVFMNTSATPATGSPNPTAGHAVVTLKNNFNTFLGSSFSCEPPLTGGSLAINGSALTAHVPYQITVVGAVPEPVFTVTTVADTAGSLAGKYWTFTDQLSNNYLVYYIVAGVGLAPALVGPLANYIAIPATIASGAADTAVATATRTALAAATNVTITGATNQVIVTGNAASTLGFANLPQVQTSGFAISAITYTNLSNDWHAVGFPLGFQPSVGASFIATTTGGATNTTARVQALGYSAVADVEVLGVTNQTLTNLNIAANGGAQVILRFVSATSSSVTTALASAPAAGSIINVSLYFDQSDVSVDGL